MQYAIKEVKYTPIEDKTEPEIVVYVSYCPVCGKRLFNIHRKILEANLSNHALIHHAFLGDS